MKTAVLVIDMINDFVTGKLGFKRAEEIVPNIKSLLSAARAKGIPVLYLRDAHSPEDPEMRVWGEHAMAGTEGSQIVPKLKPQKGEPVLSKHTYNVFYNTDLESVLENTSPHELILTGVVTDICILNSAAAAFFRGYRVTVPEDCVAAAAERDHRYSLDYMKRVYGAKITSSKAIIRGWGK